MWRRPPCGWLAPAPPPCGGIVAYASPALLRLRRADLAEEIADLMAELAGSGSPASPEACLTFSAAPAAASASAFTPGDVVRRRSWCPAPHIACCG